MLEKPLLKPRPRGEIHDATLQRDDAWAVAPYPCSETSTFLELGLSRSSLYTHNPPARQSRRHAARSRRRADRKTLHGADLRPGLMDGSRLRSVRARLRAVVVAAAIFDPMPPTPLARLAGRPASTSSTPPSPSTRFGWERRKWPSPSGSRRCCRRAGLNPSSRAGSWVTCAACGLVSLGLRCLGLDVLSRRAPLSTGCGSLWVVARRRLLRRGYEGMQVLMEHVELAGFTRAGAWGV